VNPNKEYPLRPLNLGFHNFDLQMTREEREKFLSHRADDKTVKSPDIYTHHDNAIAALMDIKKTIGGTRLASNLRFDNSPPRDNKMY